MGRMGVENRKLQDKMFPGEEYTFLTALEYLTVSSKVCKGSNSISLILLCFVQTTLYEGRLISNAHSEIYRKRDHVFKQTKVGRKVQYFSYKIDILIFRHSHLVVQYIFTNLKQVYACRQ